MAPVSFLELLRGGDRRSVGRVATVVALLRRAPSRTADLIPLLASADPVVAMRAADALEKFSREDPARLHPFRRRLLGLLARAHQQELRWHLAQLVPRLTLTPVQRTRVFKEMESYLASDSSIVRTLALQGMADLAGSSARLWIRTERHLRHATREGTPAMKARARRLLAEAARHRRRGTTRA